MASSNGGGVSGGRGAGGDAAASPQRSLVGYLKTAAWAPAGAAGGGVTPPDFDVILSARARIARNLADYTFPHRANERDLRRVAQEVRQAAHADAERLAHLYPIAIAPLSARDRAVLVDARRISPELAEGGASRYALLDDHGALTILINEEDHVRIQALAAGNDLPAALRSAEAAEAGLSRRLSWARDPQRWGYLTASLGNVGTGLRLSLLAHLPALAFLGRLPETLKVIHGLDISIRGAHGERSEAAGDLYQISNAISYGLPSGHIVGRVKPVGDHLVASERAARHDIATGDAAVRAIDSAQAAWERIEQAESLTAREALTLLSRLRLTAAAGLTPFGGRTPAPDAGLFAALVAELHTGAGLTTPTHSEPDAAPTAVRDAIQRPAKIRSALRPFYGQGSR